MALVKVHSYEDTPSSALNCRDDVSRQIVTQGVTTGIAFNVVQIDFMMIQQGGPSGNIWAQVYEDSAGDPNGFTGIGNSDTVDISTLPVVADWVSFTFSTPVTIVPGAMHIGITGDNVIDGSGCRISATKNSGYTGGTINLAEGGPPPDTWTDVASIYDMLFRMWGVSVSSGTSATIDGESIEVAEQVVQKYGNYMAYIDGSGNLKIKQIAITENDQQIGTGASHL
jgi:hypothetical protein